MALDPLRAFATLVLAPNLVLAFNPFSLGILAVRRPATLKSGCGKLSEVFMDDRDDASDVDEKRFDPADSGTYTQQQFEAIFVDVWEEKGEDATRIGSDNDKPAEVEPSPSEQEAHLTTAAPAALASAEREGAQRGEGAEREGAERGLLAKRGAGAERGAGVQRGGSGRGRGEATAFETADPTAFAPTPALATGPAAAAAPVPEEGVGEGAEREVGFVKSGKVEGLVAKFKELLVSGQEKPSTENLNIQSGEPANLKNLVPAPAADPARGVGAERRGGVGSGRGRGEEAPPTPAPAPIFVAASNSGEGSTDLSATFSEIMAKHRLSYKPQVEFALTIGKNDTVGDDVRCRVKKVDIERQQPEIVRKESILEKKGSDVGVPNTGAETFGAQIEEVDHIAAKFEAGVLANLQKSKDRSIDDLAVKVDISKKSARFLKRALHSSLGLSTPQRLLEESGGDDKLPVEKEKHSDITDGSYTQEASEDFLGSLQQPYLPSAELNSEENASTSAHDFEIQKYTSSDEVELEERDELFDESAYDEEWQISQPQVPPIVSGSPKFKPFREALPVFKYRSQILKAIDEDQVVFIEGEPGCGKTTQVGQYIIEDAAEKGLPCNIYFLQPRKINVIGAARRVAEERDEKVGDTIGYQIMHETNAGPHTHIKFCTTGVLPPRLKMHPNLDDATHVIVDEVHERQVHVDYILFALRDLARRRPDLKIILMSATMDKTLFSRYFSGGTSIVIPGRSFPVQVFFLEDVLEFTKHEIDPKADWAKSTRFRSTRDVIAEGRHEDLRLEQVEQRYRDYGPHVRTALWAMDQDEVNFDLIVSLIQGSTLQDLADTRSHELGEAVAERPSGVLVFLAGRSEISRLYGALLSLPEFAEDPARSWIMTLHGALPMREQKRVFDQPPPGVRKIVLSTNLAETSLTINNIGYVIDTCRAKEKRFDAVRRTTLYSDIVISRTNARQRRGRAARAAAGVAVHLGLTRFRHDEEIDETQLPEIQRVPLEETVLWLLSIRSSMQFGTQTVAAICSELLEPPDPFNVQKSVEQLVSLGAIQVNQTTGRERLTSLGWHLADLPVEARLGKFVLLASAFGAAATDAALTIASASYGRYPLILHNRNASMAHSRFFNHLGLDLSDHMAILTAYQKWDQLPASGGSRHKLCRVNGFDHAALTMMSDTKRLLLKHLTTQGFVAGPINVREVYRVGKQFNRGDGVLLHLARGALVKPCSPALVAALLCTAMLPHLARVSKPMQDTESKRQQVQRPSKASGDPRQQRSTGGNNPQGVWKTWYCAACGMRHDNPKAAQCRNPACATPNPALKAQGSMETVDEPISRIMIKNTVTGLPSLVAVNPRSVLIDAVAFKYPFLIYQDLVKARSGSPCITELSPVSPLALALFSPLCYCTYDQVEGNGSLIVDGWIKLVVPPSLHDSVFETRRRLSIFFDAWLDDNLDYNVRLFRLLLKRGGSQLLKNIVKALDAQN